MGHRLPEHFGLCKNIHGHSYKMIVELEGDLNEQGMIIDFYDLEKIINPLVEELDHAFMVNENDNIIMKFLDKMKSKKVVIDFDSTVENICTYISKRIVKGNLPGNVKSVSVRVYETADTYAEVKVNC